MASPTNYFSILLTDLMDYLATNVPDLKWIDYDMGQLENYDTKPSVEWPCALISFPATSYTELSGLAQMGNPTIMIRLGFAPFSQSYQAAPSFVRDKALYYFEIEQKIFNALQGYNTEYTQDFIRLSADDEMRTDKFKVRVLTFATNYEDYSAVPMRQKTPATLSIIPTII